MPPFRVPSARKNGRLWPVQRLFAMFPQGGPGLALVFLRLSVATMLFSNGSSHITAMVPRWPFPALILVAILVCIGFMTPTVSVLCYLSAIATVITVHGVTLDSAACMLSAAALALLGPSTYSVDARLFERRVPVVPPANTPLSHAVKPTSRLTTSERRAYSILPLSEGFLLALSEGIFPAPFRVSQEDSAASHSPRELASLHCVNWNATWRWYQRLRTAMPITGSKMCAAIPGGQQALCKQKVAKREAASKPAASEVANTSQLSGERSPVHNCAQ